MSEEDGAQMSPPRGARVGGDALARFYLRRAIMQLEAIRAH
jgi:hypothetical protein